MTAEKTTYCCDVCKQELLGSSGRRAVFLKVGLLCNPGYIVDVESAGNVPINSIHSAEKSDHASAICLYCFRGLAILWRLGNFAVFSDPSMPPLDLRTDVVAEIRGQKPEAA